MCLQETVAVRNKIQDLCARITKLEMIFRADTDDVAEKKRRDELLRYIIGPLLDSMLSSFQQVQKDRRQTRVII